MYDSVVIGSGPGGYTAAILCARSGRKTAVIEENMMGGTCLNWGCIPTKALISSARFYTALKKAGELGVTLENPGFDHNRIHERKDSIVGGIRKGLEKLIKANGIDIIRGRGVVEPERTVSVITEDETREIKAENIIIATGSEPKTLPFLKADGERVLYSSHALAMRDLPASMVIIGGGVVGLEFAHYYASLGVVVTVVEALPSILAGFDIQVVRRMAAAMKKQGIRIQCGRMITGASVADEVELMFEDGSSLSAERAIVAVGRKARLSVLGGECGVGIEQGRIHVDEFLETAVPGIYAIGDAVSPVMLAHVASAQAEAVTESINGRKKKFDYSLIPSCVFSSQDLASVGMTEEQLKNEGREYLTGTMNYAASSMAVACGKGEGFAKLLSAPDGRLLGAHFLGSGSTEMIHEATLAIHNRMTAEQLALTVHAHPTLSEIVMETAADTAGRAVHRIYRK